MSHGGMGGGGGHGHGGGYGGHGHHGGGTFGHHADQSPGWNMAMQIEKDVTKRLGGFDPRIMLGLTIIVFVGLITLPYTMDYLQNQQYAKKAGVKPIEVPDSSGPSPKALSLVGATLFGQDFHASEGSPPRASQPEAAVPQNSAPASSYGSPEDASGEFGSPEGESVSNSSQTANGSGEGLNPAQDAVNQMVAASGLAPAAPRQMAYAQRAAAPSAGARVTVAPPSLPYGGAVPSNDQYYVYIPNQAPAAAPAQIAGNQQYAAAQQTAYPAAQQYSAQPAAPAALAYAPGQSADPRSPFNAQTSAIVCPMGMRRHQMPQAVPLIPSSATGSDGSRRMRVWVPR